MVGWKQTKAQDCYHISVDACLFLAIHMYYYLFVLTLLPAIMLLTTIITQPDRQFERLSQFFEQIF